MRGTTRLIAAALLAATAGGGLAVTSMSVAASTVDEGKKIAFDRRKGNCMACHVIPGAALPGNIGPPLVAMKARFPDKAKLRAQIWDATKKNSQSLMPPFGRHGVLTEEEVDKVTDFIHSL